MNELNPNKSTSNLKQFSAGLLTVAFCMQIMSFTATAQFVKDRKADKVTNEMLSDESFDENAINQIGLRRNIAAETSVQAAFQN